MSKHLRRAVRKTTALRGWWLVAVVGWLYGLPGFLTDGRWWLGALRGDHLRGAPFMAAIAATAMLGLIVITRIDHLVRPIAARLRR